MKSYSTPTVYNYGKANDLIKGSCSWGSENIFLDKIGYKKYLVYRWYTYQSGIYLISECKQGYVCQSYKHDLC